MMDDGAVYRHDADSGSECNYDSDDSWLSYMAEISESEDSDDLPEPSTSTGIRHSQPWGGSTKRKRGRGTADVNIGPDGDNAAGSTFRWEEYDYNDPYSSEWLGDFPIERDPRPGVLVGDLSDKTPIDFFKLFFPDEVITLIVRETNRYAKEVLEKVEDTKFRKKKWYDVNENEIKAFIGLQIAMGLQDMSSVRQHWSTFWITQTNFCKVMARNRFQLIQSFLHFQENATAIPQDDPNYDPLWKISPLLHLTQHLYAETFYPGKQVSIDESMVKFKGRSAMKQYLPDKPTKWGFKAFSLVDSSSKYCLRNIFYCGKKHFKVHPGKNVGETVVSTLLDGYMDRNHILYCDSAYTSPELFLALQERNTGAVGTVVENRKGFPDMLKKKQLKLTHHGEPVFARCDDLVAFAWHDSKRMYMLSTVHTNNTTDKTVRDRKAQGGRREVEKPVIAENYNAYMGGVDHFDQRMGSYCYPYRNKKWYTAIYHYVKEIALINGYILYSNCTNEASVKSAVKFRQCVIDSLVAPLAAQRATTATGRVTPAPTLPNASRLNAAAMNHFPSKFDDPKHRPRCVVCNSIGVRRQTQLYCLGCEDSPALCITPCFRIFHTMEDYKVARRNVNN